MSVYLVLREISAKVKFFTNLFFLINITAVYMALVRHTCTCFNFRHFLRLEIPPFQGLITASISHVKTTGRASTLKMATSARVLLSLLEQIVKVNCTFLPC